MAYFDKYEKFKINGTVKPIPGIKIPIVGTDKQVLYKVGVTRLEKISQITNVPLHVRMIVHVTVTENYTIVWMGYQTQCLHWMPRDFKKSMY